MKSAIKFCAILALIALALTGSNVSGQDAVTTDENHYLPTRPALTLTLKVSTMISSGSEESLKMSELTGRNQTMEQSLWAILWAETRVYSHKRFHPSFDLCRCYGRWYYVGNSFLFRQARREAHHPFNPHARDSFESFFDYTDFLYRSSRSVITAGGRNQ